jgi:YD repeat-containing protein
MIFSSGGADRESSFPNMRAGALQKITYPTGGTSDFSYAAHQVFVNKNYYTSSSPWQINATGTGATSTSVSYPVPVTTPTMFKYRVQNVNGGGGTVYLKSASTTLVFSDNGWNYTRILVQPGDYQFYCTSSGGSASQGIQAELSQLNQYTNLETVLVGGLRIATLTTNDGSGANPIVQTFNYTNNNGQDQGVLFSRPNYIGIARNDRLNQSGIAMGFAPGGGYNVQPSDGCNPTNAAYNVLPDYFISPSSLHPMRTLQGSHFGYSQVKVTQADGGYTIYQYKLEPNVVQDVCVRAINRNFCDPAAPNFPGAPDQFDPSRGELRATYIFNAANTLLKSTQYQMDYLSEPVGVHGLIVKQALGFAGYFATEYELKTYKKTKSTTLEFTYDATNPAQPPVGIITEVFYGSNYHNQNSKRVISEVTQGDMISNVVKGKVLSERRSSYVADLTTSTCDPDYSWNTTYASQYASILQDYNTTVSGSCDALCKFNAWQHFTYLTNEVRKAYITNKSSYENGKYDCLIGKANAAGPELKTLFDLKIRNQLDPVEVSQWRDGNFLQSSYITFQDVSSNRVDIFPSKYESIQTSIPLASSSFSPGSNNGVAIIKDTKYAQEETYSYSNGRPVETIAKNGIVTSYIWGYNNTLPIVKAVGVSYATLKSAYDAVSGNLSTLRSQSSLAGAQISTYTYDPLIGMTSQTDPNNVTSTYVYDKLGRLSYVKDKDNNIVNKMKYNYKIE